MKKIKIKEGGLWEEKEFKILVDFEFDDDDDIKNKIKEDNYNDFIKISDDNICHVRPKGKDSRDMMKTPAGKKEKKRCFWLNSSYIKKIISES